MCLGAYCPDWLDFPFPYHTTPKPPPSTLTRSSFHTISIPTPKALPMPPKGKRKRSVSPVAAVAPAGPPASTSKKSRLNDGFASDAGAKVEVVYELVGSDKKCKRSMSEFGFV